MRALVVGGTIVALSALYESRTGYNAFDHLADWIPALIYEPRVDFLERWERPRVRVCSAPHRALGLRCS